MGGDYIVRLTVGTSVGLNPTRTVSKFGQFHLPHFPEFQKSHYKLSTGARGNKSSQRGGNAPKHCRTINYRVNPGLQSFIGNLHVMEEEYQTYH